jgi:hypothetical protein
MKIGSEIEKVTGSMDRLKETYEPCHNKTNIMGLRPAWIQTSLRKIKG